MILMYDKLFRLASLLIFLSERVQSRTLPAADTRVYVTVASKIQLEADTYCDSRMYDDLTELQYLEGVIRRELPTIFQGQVNHFVESELTTLKRDPTENCKVTAEFDVVAQAEDTQGSAVSDEVKAALTTLLGNASMLGEVKLDNTFVVTMEAPKIGGKECKDILDDNLCATFKRSDCIGKGEEWALLSCPQLCAVCATLITHKPTLMPITKTDHNGLCMLNLTCQMKRTAKGLPTFQKCGYESENGNLAVYEDDLDVWNISDKIKSVSYGIFGGARECLAGSYTCKIGPHKSDPVVLNIGDVAECRYSKSARGLILTDMCESTETSEECASNALPASDASGCEDKLTDGSCASITNNKCWDPNQAWARENCAKRCNLCSHNEVKTPTIIIARVNEENACGVKITCQNVVAAQQWITKTSIEKCGYEGAIKPHDVEDALDKETATGATHFNQSYYFGGTRECLAGNYKCTMNGQKSAMVALKIKDIGACNKRKIVFGKNVHDMCANNKTTANCPNNVDLDTGEPTYDALSAKHANAVDDDQWEPPTPLEVRGSAEQHLVTLLVMTLACFVATLTSLRVTSL